MRGNAASGWRKGLFGSAKGAVLRSERVRMTRQKARFGMAEGAIRQQKSKKMAQQRGRDGGERECRQCVESKTGGVQMPVRGFVLSRFCQNGIAYLCKTDGAVTTADGLQ